MFLVCVKNDLCISIFSTFSQQTLLFAPLEGAASLQHPSPHCRRRLTHRDIMYTTGLDGTQKDYCVTWWARHMLPSSNLVLPHRYPTIPLWWALVRAASHRASSSLLYAGGREGETERISVGWISADGSVCRRIEECVHVCWRGQTKEPERETVVSMRERQRGDSGRREC